MMNDQTALSTERLPTNKPRVALLVDGENVSSTLAGQTLKKAESFGDVVFRRVYGNAALLNGWNSAPGFRIQHSGTGKNATDMLLCVEAMDMALNRKADLIALAASDRDYTHLATYLRENGIRLIGFGEDKTPEAFRKACARFIPLTPSPAKVPPPARQTFSSLETVVMALINEKAEADGLLIRAVNQLVQQQGLAKISTTPEKTWRAWLTARPNLFALDPRSPDARVRLLKPYPRTP